MYYREYVSGQEIVAVKRERIYSKRERETIHFKIYQYILNFMAKDGSLSKRGNKESDSVEPAPPAPRLLASGCWG